MSEKQQDYINYRVEKSTEIYRDAVLLAEHERWNSCINRLYYSSFYLVSALLYQRAIKAETHKETKTQFNMHFVKKGLINKEYGKLYSHLFDWRQETDYADFVEFDQKTVIPLLDQVKAFNDEIKRLMETDPEGKQD